MSNGPLSEAIYDRFRTRGITVREFSLTVTDRAVSIRGEVRSYYQMQLCLTIVSAFFQGREIENGLVVHPFAPDQIIPHVVFDGSRRDKP